MRRVLAVVAGLGVVVACGSQGGTRQASPRQTDRITFEEIEPLRVRSAFDVVQQLRPEYLRTRGSPSVNNPTPQEAVVYVDGVRMGPPATLRQVAKEALLEIRYMNPNEATTQYGTGHRGGAIIVTTR